MHSKCSSCGRLLQCDTSMRVLITVMLVALMPVGAYAALTPGGVENVSDLININIPDVNNVIDPSYLQPMEAAEAAGLNVPGMTGGLTHPACVAETARRAPMGPPQPPPHGDFPCMVPTSNGSGIVDGVCFVHECRGVASTGLDGLMSALGNLSSLSSMVSSILSNLLKPSPSSPPGNNENITVPQTPATPQSTSLLITSAPLTELDMSKLFSDSAVIVRNLLGALNP